MFFDGDSGAKRKVNLRGNSKADQDKKAFLDKQKQEREKRLHEKLQQKAALKIQAFRRGRVDVRRAMQRERIAWDKEVESILHPHDGHPQTASLLPLIRSILFFYKDGTDDNRLERLCVIILTGIMNKAPSSYLLMCADSTRPMWLSQAKRLLVLVQNKFDGNPVFLQTVDVLTDPIVLDTVIKNEPVSRSIACNLIDHLIEHGLFQRIRASLKRIPKVLNLALRRFIKTHAPSTHIAARFFGSILSIPGLISSLPAPFIAQSLRPALVVAFESLAASSNVHSVLSPYLETPEDMEGLIGNVLDLAKPLIHQSSPELLQSYIMVLNFLLCSLPETAMQISDDESDDPTPTPVHPPASTRKHLQLSAITDPTVLKELFQMSLASLPPIPSPPRNHTSYQNAPALSSYSPPALIALCRLIDTLTNGNGTHT